MIVKKTTLYWVIPTLIVLLTAGTLIITSAQKKKNEERERQVFRESIERSIDREYRHLKSEFDHYAEITCDWDYSDDFRDRAARKMYELTGITWHNGWHTYYPSEMRDKIAERQDDVRRALQSKATENVRNELLGR